jgi:hypothetical protein
MVIGGTEDSSDGEGKAWLGTPEEAGFLFSLFLFLDLGKGTTRLLCSTALIASLFMVGFRLQQYGRINCAFIRTIATRMAEAGQHTLYVRTILYDSGRG